MNSKKPEQLSGHAPTDHLIAPPGAAGNFRWHTLRSCMGRRLPVACPQYVPYADYGKITPTAEIRSPGVQTDQ